MWPLLIVELTVTSFGDKILIHYRWRYFVSGVPRATTINFGMLSVNRIATGLFIIVLYNHLYSIYNQVHFHWTQISRNWRNAQATLPRWKNDTWPTLKWNINKYSSVLSSVRGVAVYSVDEFTTLLGLQPTPTQYEGSQNKNCGKTPAGIIQFRCHFDLPRSACLTTPETSPEFPCGVVQQFAEICQPLK